MEFFNVLFNPETQQYFFNIPEKDELEKLIKRILKKTYTDYNDEEENLSNFLKKFPIWARLFDIANTIWIHETRAKMVDEGIGIYIYSDVKLMTKPVVTYYLQTNYELLRSGRNDTTRMPSVILTNDNKILIMLPDIVHDADELYDSEEVRILNDMYKEIVDILTERLFLPDININRISKTTIKSLSTYLETYISEALSKYFLDIEKQIKDTERQVRNALIRIYKKRFDYILQRLKDEKHRNLQKFIDTLRKFSKYGKIYYTEEDLTETDQKDQYIVLELHKPIQPKYFLHNNKVYKITKPIYFYEKLIYSISEGIWSHACGRSPHIKHTEYKTRCSVLCSGDKKYNLDGLPELIKTLQYINGDSTYWDPTDEDVKYFVLEEEDKKEIWCIEEDEEDEEYEDEEHEEEEDEYWETE